jgi:uncharacterized phiE125 gp8 family phage protein
MSALKRYLAPEALISIQEAKDHLRYDQADQDALIERLIATATDDVERLTAMRFCTQTWDLVLDAAPCGEVLTLPFGPLQSVTSITSYNTASIASVMDSASYYVDTWSRPGRIVLNEGHSWPTSLRSASAIVVRFVAGFGDPADVPSPAKDAVLRRVAHYFRWRGDDDDASRAVVDDPLFAELIANAGAW